MTTTTNLPARRTAAAAAPVQPTPPTVQYVPNRQAARDLQFIGWIAMGFSGALLLALLLGLLAANPI
jgi:hypothetical protein